MSSLSSTGGSLLFFLEGINTDSGSGFLGACLHAIFVGKKDSLLPLVLGMPFFSHTPFFLLPGARGAGLSEPSILTVRLGGIFFL